MPPVALLPQLPQKIISEPQSMQVTSHQPILGTSKPISQLLDNYQKARIAFAQGIADLASREVHLDQLADNHLLIVPLLRPLLLDSHVPVQQAAALALGRLANHSCALADLIVQGDVLPHIVFSLDSPNRFYKKSAAFVLRSIARHSPDLAGSVVKANAVDALGNCLKDFDPNVKESAAWALGYIAKHTTELAQSVVDAGLVPLLVQCLQEPETSLRRIAASALSDISKHSAELAQVVVESGALAPLTSQTSHADAKLTRQALTALSNIARHSIDLAESVIDTKGLFPNVLLHLKDIEPATRRQACILICELAKHARDVAQLLVNVGAVSAVVQYLSTALSTAAMLVPGIMALGYVAAFSETLALAVIVSKGVNVLIDLIEDYDKEDDNDDEFSTTDLAVSNACVWTITQIGHHSPDHAKALTDLGVLPKLLGLLTNTHTLSEIHADLVAKTTRALKSIINMTLDLDALEPLIMLNTPTKVLQHALTQVSKLIPSNASMRRKFVTSGCCQRVQQLNAQHGTEPTSSKLTLAIRKINACFPKELVQYYTPGYSAVLLDTLDDTTKPVTHFSNTNLSDSKSATQRKSNTSLSDSKSRPGIVSQTKSEGTDESPRVPHTPDDRPPSTGTRAQKEPEAAPEPGS